MVKERRVSDIGAIFGDEEDHLDDQERPYLIVPPHNNDQDQNTAESIASLELTGDAAKIVHCIKGYLGTKIDKLASSFNVIANGVANEVARNKQYRDKMACYNENCDKRDEFAIKENESLYCSCYGFFGKSSLVIEGLRPKVDDSHMDKL